MKMNVALELEKGRQTIEDWRKIYLSKEGKFYRCYNESAFLLKNYVCTEEMQRERGDARPLQAKRYVSRKREYVMVGFPEESLSKHVPSYGNAEMLDTNDMVLTVSEEVVSSDNSVEMMQTAYEDWRNSLEVHVPDQTSSATVKNGGSSKPDMGCRHFGRYVDDSFVVGSDKEWLLSLVDSAERFLQERLHLELNRKKLHLLNVRHGVEFLGAFIKPETTYISNAAIGRMVIKVNEMDMTDHEAVFRSINSFLGVLSHYDSFNIRCRLFFTEPFLKIGYFNRDVTKFTLHNNSQYSFN